MRALVVALLLWLPSVASAETWNVWIDPRLPRDRVLMTLDAWSAAANVEWVERKTDDALIIRLGPIAAPPGLEYAGLYEQRTNTITLVDPDPFRVSQVLMHELGHFLGLYLSNSSRVSPHCADKNCVMWYATTDCRRVCGRCVAKVIRRYGPPAERIARQ